MFYRYLNLKFYMFINSLKKIFQKISNIIPRIENVNLKFCEYYLIRIVQLPIEKSRDRGKSLR